MAGSDTDVSSEVADQTPGAPSSSLDPVTAAKVEEIATTPQALAAVKKEESNGLKGQISEMLGGSADAAKNAELAEKQGFAKNVRDNYANDNKKDKKSDKKGWEKVGQDILNAGGKVGRAFNGAIKQWWKGLFEKGPNGVRNTQLPKKPTGNKPEDKAAYKAALNKEAFMIQQDFKDIAKRSASDYKPGKGDEKKLTEQQAIQARNFKMKDLEDLKDAGASPEIIGAVKIEAAKGVDLASKAADREGVTDAEFDMAFKQQQQLAASGRDDLEAGKANINDDAQYEDGDRQAFKAADEAGKDIQAQPALKGRNRDDFANEDRLQATQEGKDGLPDGLGDGKPEGESDGPDEDNEEDLDDVPGLDEEDEGSLEIDGDSVKYTPPSGGGGMGPA
jgi:hypothetical protein